MLEIDGLAVRFDGIQALTRVSIAIPTGTRIGVIGPNGSGKTTLLNAISGLIPLAAGTIAVNGQNISRLAPHEIARVGVARTFQTVRLFRRLSVLDNVMPRHAPDAHKAALAALDATGLHERQDEMAGDLTYVDQRRLEIARAVAQRPRVLLVDEPTSGISRIESDEIVALIDRCFDRETTILMVEHNVNAIVTLCARSVLLVEGRLAADGTTRDLLHDQRLMNVYLGTQARTDTNR